jgi:tripartite-type tricarboxylate transporter receptor subunit TctC
MIAQCRKIDINRGQLILTLSILLAAGGVSAQAFPNKPIRLVTSVPGGSSDIVARTLARELTASLEQPVVVDNRGALAGIEAVARAAPDGYTLMVGSNSFWIGPLMQKMSYDPVKDFSPVSLTQISPNILVVHPTLPAKSVKELIALAKAKPGALNVASGSTGAVSHLAAELFKSMAGVDIVTVPFKGAGPALLGVLSGQVQLMFATSGSAAPHLAAGKLRALAVTTTQPSALAPDLPTIAASGLPGYDATAMWGVLAPSRTPAMIIKRLNEEIVRGVRKADVKDRLFNAGLETVGSSPSEFAAAIKSEMTSMGKVIKDAGLRQ